MYHPLITTPFHLIFLIFFNFSLLEISELVALPPDLVSDLVGIDIGVSVYDFVKELVENSIDSGASQIIIQLTNGGYTNITVTDNGCGIPNKEFNHLCHFYTTSKNPNFPENTTENIDDNLNHDKYDESETKKLNKKQNYKLFGYHGTSLATISCSRPVTITSRTRDEDMATKGSYNFSSLTSELQKVSADYGTKVEIGNFLDSIDHFDIDIPSTSHNIAEVKKLITAYAVIYKDINFRFIASSQLPTFESSASKDIINSFKTIYNYDDHGSSLCPIIKHIEANDFDCLLLLTKPGATLINPQISLFVDGMKIKHKQLKEIILKAYKENNSSATKPTAHILFKTNGKNFAHNFIQTHFSFPYEKTMLEEFQNIIKDSLEEINNNSKPSQEIDESIFNDFVNCIGMQRFPYNRQQDKFYQQAFFGSPIQTTQTIHQTSPTMLTSTTSSSSIATSNLIASPVATPSQMSPIHTPYHHTRIITSPPAPVSPPAQPMPIHHTIQAATVQTHVIPHKQIIATSPTTNIQQNQPKTITTHVIQPQQQTEPKRVTSVPVVRHVKKIIAAPPSSIQQSHTQQVQTTIQQPQHAQVIRVSQVQPVQHISPQPSSSNLATMHSISQQPTVTTHHIQPKQIQIAPRTISIPQQTQTMQLPTTIQATIQQTMSQQPQQRQQTPTTHIIQQPTVYHIDQSQQQQQQQHQTPQIKPAQVNKPQRPFVRKVIQPNK